MIQLSALQAANSVSNYLGYQQLDYSNASSRDGRSRSCLYRQQHSLQARGVPIIYTGPTVPWFDDT